VASLVLSVAGGLVLLVLLRFLYQGLSRQRRFTQWPEIVVYYLVPAAAAVGLLASVRLAPLAKLRLLLSGAALTASVYGVELVLLLSDAAPARVFSAIDGQPQLRPVMAALAGSRNQQRDAAELARKFATAIDTRTPAEAVAALRRDQDADAIPIVTPSNHLFVTQADGSITSAIRIGGREVIPLAGVSATATLLCNENGPWVHYRSDSHGFNNSEEAWRFPTLDVAALGDSFTHGYCVPRDRNFVDLIRQRTAATLNLGIAGDGPLLMLATLEEYLPPLRPKTVLWFYYEGNDLTDLQTERRSALLRGYLSDGFRQPDLARQQSIDQAILAEIPRLMARERADLENRNRPWPTLARGVMTVAKLTRVRDRLAPLGATDPEAVATAADFAGANNEVFREILRQAKLRVERWNGQLYFVYLPEWSRYTAYRSWGKERRDDVLKLVRSLGIPIIDIDPVFQAHGDPLSLFPFRGVGHYTEAGHRLVAEAVLRDLQLNRRAPQ
jgi:lysophospholipase L1-like esterase